MEYDAGPNEAGGPNIGLPVAAAAVVAEWNGNVDEVVADNVVPTAELPANVPLPCRRGIAALRVASGENPNALAAEPPACVPLPLMRGTAALEAAIGGNPNTLPDELPACVPLPLRKGTAALRGPLWVPDEVPLADADGTAVNDVAATVPPAEAAGRAAMLDDDTAGGAIFGYTAASA